MGCPCSLPRELIGHIHLPEVASNLCFRYHLLNRLFITAGRRSMPCTSKPRACRSPSPAPRRITLSRHKLFRIIVCTLYW